MHSIGVKKTENRIKSLKNLSSCPKVETMTAKLCLAGVCFNSSLKICSDGYSTTSPERWFQCLTTISIRGCFVVLFLFFSWCLAVSPMVQIKLISSHNIDGYVLSQRFQHNLYTHFRVSLKKNDPLKYICVCLYRYVIQRKVLGAQIITIRST